MGLGVQYPQTLGGEDGGTGYLHQPPPELMEQVLQSQYPPLSADDLRKLSEGVPSQHEASSTQFGTPPQL